MTQTEVARDIGLDRSTTGAVIIALDRRGLVGRDIGFQNCREWRVVVTERGRKLLAAATVLLERSASDLVAPTPRPLPRRRLWRDASG